MDTSPGRIRVLVAEDNADLSAALCALVAQEPDMALAGTVDRCGVLLDAVRGGHVHVVVLDLNLGGESSVGPMRTVLHAVPRVAVVLYSGYDRLDLVRGLASLGTCEYVAKSGDAAELLAAIRRAARGTTGTGG